MKRSLKAMIPLLGAALNCSSLFAQYRGGSNYAWYQQPDPWNCFSREAYGVIYNYDVAKSTIDDQLAHN